MQVREKLARRAAKVGLNLGEGALGGLESYFELLRKWNLRVSLTALPVEDVGDEAVDRLLIEPALAAEHLPNPDAIVIDVGSGGGSPAIPMKLMSPGISMLMVESKTRKAAFLREASRQLRLTDTNVESLRLEELLGRSELHGSADVVTLRAVRPDQKTLAAVQSLLKLGGSLFLFASISGRAIVPTPELLLKDRHTLLQQRGSCLEIFRKVS